MKIIYLFFFCFLLFNKITSAQPHISGEYEVCFDSLLAGEDYQYCMNIILNEDNTYNLQLRSGNKYNSSVGTWEIKGNKIRLIPETGSDYFDLHNDLLDKLIPERSMKLKDHSLLWEVMAGQSIINRELKKIQKCNC